LELESGNVAAGGSSKMPLSATWDGQLSGSGIVDPWSPKPAVTGHAADPWGMTALAAQSQLTMPSPVSTNDPWSAAGAPVATSWSLHHIMRGSQKVLNLSILDKKLFVIYISVKCAPPVFQ